MVWSSGLSWYQVFSLPLILAGWLTGLKFKKHSAHQEY
jgi:hypothetical protein